MVKRYDQAYFDRWYRDPASRLWTEAAVERKVRMVVGIAEHLLDGPVRSVLDVGCGEGSWQRVLKRLRPAARYRGIDSSEYVVRRFGRRRHIVHGEMARLEATRIRGYYDLVVCCDVLHYVPTADVRRGLAFMMERAGALAYLEAYAWGDTVDGDHRQFQRRGAATYRRLFREAGFSPIGLHCYVPTWKLGDLTRLESSAL